MLIVLILSSVWNLVYAVGIGLVIASLMFMKKIGDLTTERSKISTLSSELPWDDESGFPKNLHEEVYVEHISGPLFFGSTSDFQALSKQIPDTASAVIIRMDKMRYIDQSGLYAMEDVLNDLAAHDIKIVLVHLMEQPRYLLEKIDIIPDLVPTEQIFDNFEESIVWIKANVKDKY
jgi:SulP family sulfate permease